MKNASIAERTKVEWFITILLLLQACFAVYVFFLVQFGDSFLEPRSTFGAFGSLVLLSAVFIGAITVFLRKIWAWVIFAGLAFYRAVTVATHVSSSAPEFEVWQHVAFLLEFTAIGAYLYWQRNKHAADA